MVLINDITLQYFDLVSQSRFHLTHKVEILQSYIIAYYVNRCNSSLSYIDQVQVTMFSMFFLEKVVQIYNQS